MTSDRIVCTEPIGFLEVNDYVGHINISPTYQVMEVNDRGKALKLRNLHTQNIITSYPGGFDLHGYYMAKGKSPRLIETLPEYESLFE